MRSGFLPALSATFLLAVPASAQAPPPPALTGATVHQQGTDLVARLEFSAPVPAADPDRGHRVCLTFARGRACLRGEGARLARRRGGGWVIVGSARARRSGDAVVVRAAAGRLGVALGRRAHWTVTADWGAPEQTLTGELRTRRLTPFAPKRHLRLLATSARPTSRPASRSPGRSGSTGSTTRPCRRAASTPTQRSCSSAPTRASRSAA